MSILLCPELPAAVIPFLGTLGAPSWPGSVEWLESSEHSLLLSAVCLFVVGLLAALRRSLARAVAERVRSAARSATALRRIEALLGQLERVAVSVGVLEIAASVGGALLLAHGLAGPAPLSWRTLALALAVAVPALWLVSDVLARALALRHGARLLAGALPLIHVAQLPLVGIGWVFELARRVVLRALGIRDDTEATREIVAGLREVLADAEVSGNLEDTEREIIGNVMEIRDQDVAALMTPRTEIQAADVEDGVLAAARVLAASGHSRIPVYEGTLDTVIGTISARDIVQLMAAGKVENSSLRQIVHPAYFVPETKPVAELLAEMRRAKLKLAIVLDEYGGTAGLVTMGDILSELVGEIPDEYDHDQPAPLRALPGGVVEVDAGLHVSEVNEALDLDLPEEADFETLGGFVLAELGHFPKRGESFRRNGNEFEVTEANDRRVLKVRVRRLQPAGTP